VRPTAHWPRLLRILETKTEVKSGLFFKLQTDWFNRGRRGQWYSRRPSRWKFSGRHRRPKRNPVITDYSFNGDRGGVDPFPEIAVPAAPPVEAAPADNWKKDRVCWGKFCLTINYVYETPTSKYMDADNCIACHIEKINEQLKKTISHSLSPNKIPGNLIETPKCKNGLSASLSSLSANLNIQLCR